MLAAQRHKEILRVLRIKGSVSVSTLIENLNASSATIRRDLDELEAQNQLRRTHGGAVPFDTLEDPGFPDRAIEQVTEKTAIAVAASRLVKAGQSIALDAGTTMDIMAQAIRGISPLTVVTNSLAVTSRLGGAEGITTVMTGGTLQWDTQSLVGPLAESALTGIMVDIAFMTARGLDAEAGVMNSNMTTPGVKRALANAARQIVVLADHTKFERTGLISVIPPNRIRTLITDWRTPEDRLAPFRSLGIQVIVAQPVE